MYRLWNLSVYFSHIINKFVGALYIQNKYNYLFKI